MYIVIKDGMYLMNYRNFGIQEFDVNGEFGSVLTGLYSTDRRDAMLVEQKSIADALGAKAIYVNPGINRKGVKVQ